MAIAPRHETLEDLFVRRVAGDGQAFGRLGGEGREQAGGEYHAEVGGIDMPGGRHRRGNECDRLRIEPVDSCHQRANQEDHRVAVAQWAAVHYGLKADLSAARVRGFRRGRGISHGFRLRYPVNG